jgi:RecJ-like exonuclease
MKFAICYVSTAASGISDDEIEDLLKLSSTNNNRDQITGILLFSNGNFFQVLEGEKQVITEVFEKIKQDRRHRNLISIFKKEIENYQFTTYEEEFLSLDTTYDGEKINYYASYIEKLDPSIQSPVKYVLKNFS